MDMSEMLMTLAVWLNDRRFLVLTFYWLVIPTMTLWFLDDWFGIMHAQGRVGLQRARGLILSALIPYGLFHICYSFRFDVNSTEWKVHFLASLYNLLFVLMVMFNFSASLDIKRSVLISYVSVTVSFLTLFAVDIPRVITVVTLLFRGGIIGYFIGLILIWVKYRSEQILAGNRNL